MRSWLSSLWSDRVPDIALALALGYALVTLADRLAHVPVSVLAQHFGRSPFGEDQELLGIIDQTAPYYLNFGIGSTYFAYGPILAAALALSVVVLVAWFVVRRRNRVLGECPFCASRIPYESTHCAYCGSGIAAGEP
jgi:hypothetical protein